jgi:hypothetical protein
VTLFFLGKKGMAFFIITKLHFISFLSMLVVEHKKRKSAEEILNELKASFFE